MALCRCISHIGEIIPSVGIIWFIPVWFLCGILCIHIEHTLWTIARIPTFFICSALSTILSITGFGYELGSLVIVLSQGYAFDDNLLSAIIYTSAALMMITDLLATSVLTVIG